MAPIEQSGFGFDAPMVDLPTSQMPKPEIRPENADMVERIRAILLDLPADICSADPLIALGYPKHSLTGWHIARSMDALTGGLPPEFQAYRTSEDKLRFRRLPPLEACPGFEGDACQLMTRGGIRCERHRAMEFEDLYSYA